MASGIAVNVLINLIAAGLGYFGRYAMERAFGRFVKDRRVREFWSFLGQPCHVFLPIIRENEVGAAGGFGDLLATSRLIGIANTYYPPADKLVIHTRQSAYASCQDDNLVVIGGGKYNSIYRDLIDRIDPPLHFFDTATESFQEVRNRESTIIYSPEYAPDGSLVFDIGILVFSASPFVAGRKVLIAAGSHTYGSAIAVQYLSELEGLRDTREARASRNFMFVVGARVSDTGTGRAQRISNVLTW